MRENLFILSCEDDQKCKECYNTYYARRKNKECSAEFMVHKCKSCDYLSDLRTKSRKSNPRRIDKYRDMILHYENFVFEIVNDSDEMKDEVKRRKAEKEYACKKNPLYWYG